MHVSSDPTRAGMWIVEEIHATTDRRYPIHVSGRYRDGGPIGPTFSWAVPNVADDAYDLSTVGEAWRSAHLAREAA